MHVSLTHSLTDVSFLEGLEKRNIFNIEKGCSAETSDYLMAPEKEETKNSYEYETTNLKKSCTARLKALKKNIN